MHQRAEQDTTWWQKTLLDTWASCYPTSFSLLLVEIAACTSTQEHRGRTCVMSELTTDRPPTWISIGLFNICLASVSTCSS